MKITRQRLEAFLNKHQTTELILNIGAGSNTYLDYFPNRVTLDVDSGSNPDIVGDIHNLPISDETYNFILCTEVLEHVRDPKRGIAELHRVAKPDGLLLLTTRFVFPIHSNCADYWRFTKYGLLELFKDWEVIEIAPDTQSFSTIGVLLQRIAYQTKLPFCGVLRPMLLILAHLLPKLDFLIKKEFKNIENTISEDHIMPCGYFILARKIK